MSCISKQVGIAILMIGAVSNLARTNAAEVTASMEPPSCVPGDTAIAWITMTDTAGITGADISLRLPDFVVPGKVETVDPTAGFLIASHAQPGQLDLALASPRDLSPDQAVLLRIPVLITRAVEPGHYRLIFTRLQLYDTTASPVVSQAHSGTLVVKPPPADQDQDGLPDDWETAYFGNTAATGETDTDQDGVLDVGEFIAGTDPTRADSVFAVEGVTTQHGQGPVLLRWSARQNRSYEVEWSDDPLGPGMTWHQVYRPDIEFNGVDAQWTDDGSRTYQLPHAARQRLYRVRTHMP